MNGLTALNLAPIRAWSQRVALVLASLVFLLALTATARAQSRGAGKVSMQDIDFVGSVGVAWGQLLRITVAIPNNQDRSGTPGGKLYVATDLGVFISIVKVFDVLTGAEIASFELRDPNAGLHTFDIGGRGNDVLFGGDNTGTQRVQLRIEVKLGVRYDRSTNEFGAGVYPPSFELVDKLSDRTTVLGGLLSRP